MIRQHKKMILLTSIITLFSIFIGLLLWNQLPDSLATHWGINNEPNGYASKTFAVFGLPLIMLLGHAVSVIAMNIDPKVKNISEKVYFVILWIIPLLSLFICNVLYGYNLGFQLDMGFLCGLMIGVFYLILGNFIPKVKPNYTIGFRISWALCDPENWYRTHRFGGKCMVIGGIIMIVTAPFQNMWILIALILVPCILPVIYSYLYYRKIIS